MVFNLFVAFEEDAWNGAPGVYPRSRVFEFTTDALAERFGGLQGEALNELMSLPAIFAYEQRTGGDAHIGWIVRVLMRGDSVRIEYELGQTLPTISSGRLSELEWELDIENWEMSRTHWAVKDVDLFQVLIEAGIFTQDQLRDLPPNRRPVLNLPQETLPIPIQPTVFRLQRQEQEPDLVSVMMPFNAAFQNVYAKLQEACADLELRCLNANEIWEQTEIIQDVFSLIYRSKVVVCDFSDRNPNVFYEAGIAHTLGRTVVPIVQNREHIPFDLAHHRHIQYSSNNEGLEALKRDIMPRLRFLTQV